MAVTIVMLWAVLILVNFGCSAPSRCEHYHCNATGKAIKVHICWYTIQQNEHTSGTISLNSYNAKTKFVIRKKPFQALSATDVIRFQFGLFWTLFGMIYVILCT